MKFGALAQKLGAQSWRDGEAFMARAGSPGGWPGKIFRNAKTHAM